MLHSKKFVLGLLVVLLVLFIGGYFAAEPCDAAWQKVFYNTLTNEYVLLGGGLVALFCIGFLIYSSQSLPSIFRLVILILLSCFLLSVILASLNTVRLKTPNTRRGADIGQLRLALELYADANDSLYPTMLDAVVQNNACKSGSCIGIMPIDPVRKIPYEYRVAPDRKSYVLRAFLADNIPPRCSDVAGYFKPIFLDTDKDGEVLGLDCNDPAYCQTN